MKKYELTDKTINMNGVTLHRIKALKDFSNVKAGDLGGWIQSEKNLSQEGDCWVYDNARVLCKAVVNGNAKICREAIIDGEALIQANSFVNDFAHVGNYAVVEGNSKICNFATILENSHIHGNAVISGNSIVSGEAEIRDNAFLRGYATVDEKAIIKGKALIDGFSHVRDRSVICEDASIESNRDYVTVSGFGRINRPTTFFKTRSGDIGVSCGCFHGNLKQFREAVKETHGDTKLGKEYLMLADLMEYRLS